MNFPAEFAIAPELFRSPPIEKHLLSSLPIDGQHSLSVSTGRTALAKALDSLPKERISGRAWLPSLCCTSLALPLLRRGFTLEFYSSPDAAPFPAVASGDVFVYLHFCGFPNHTVEKALDTLPTDNRPFVVEDCVHALFTPGVGKSGDFVLYSFRKFLPVPDGGLLLSHFPIDPYLAPPLEAFVSMKTIGQITGSPSLLRKGEILLDEDEEPRAPSEIGRFLLDRAEWEHIPAARRKNCRLLAGLLDVNIPQGEEAVPLGLPVWVERGKAELERQLRAAGFEPPLSWEDTPDDHRREASRLVILPCDERMGDVDLDALARTVVLFEKRNGGPVTNFFPEAQG